MPDPGLFEVSGVGGPQEKYSPIAFIRFIGGLQTQRSPLASIDTRYNSRYLGGKPDALFAGSNVEISNSLTLQRRPGLLAYGTSSIPAPLAFFAWDSVAPVNITLVVDTASAVYNYSPTHAGIYWNKATGAGQTNFFSLANTLYAGDGVDRYKITGPNLLLQSNTFGSGAGTAFSIQSPWTDGQLFSLTGGQTDPTGGSASWQVIWSAANSGSFLEQDVTPNYTPIASNTFTFSIWMKETGGAVSIDLSILDQSTTIATSTAVLTGTWTKYQVTGTMGAGSTVIKVKLGNPTTTNTMEIYGAQLEVGGPAGATQITTTHAQGVWLWGIQAPDTAPTVLASSTQIGNAWQPNTAYTSDIRNLTSVATGTGVYSGAISGGAGNALAGFTFKVTGFQTSANNGTFLCTGSTASTLTLNNASSVSETHAATAQPVFSLTSVSAGTGVYTGVIRNGSGNAYAGYAFTISGFSNSVNNGTFLCTASSNSTITLENFESVSEATAASAFPLGQAITDSNGNLQVATASGTSGSVQPTWATALGATTPDGNQTFSNIQTAVNSALASSASVSFNSNVTAGHSILVFCLVTGGSAGSPTFSDNVSDVFTTITNANSGSWTIYLAWVQSAVGGATTVSASASNGKQIWLGIVETSNLTSADASNTNTAQSVQSGSTVFQTGQVTTTNTYDLLVSFIQAVGGNKGQPGIPSGGSPSGFNQFVSQATAADSSGDISNLQADYKFLTATTTANPQWTVTFPYGGSRITGITGSFKSSNTTTLIWTNYGPVGLTSETGYQYYYSFMNSATGHVSNVSPLSSSTGAIAGQSVTVSGVGMQTTPSGDYAHDPQVDTIAVFRNVSGGGIWYQVATFANPGTSSSAGTWSLTDIAPDNGESASSTVLINGVSTSVVEALNTDIFAPVGLLNSIPPSGAINPSYFAGRMWVSVGTIAYFNSAADNYSLLNISQNGVPAECWALANTVPFNSPIVRFVPTSIGLETGTNSDFQVITGSNLTNFTPVNIFPGHGIRTYNAVAIDGSNVMIFTSDRQALSIGPSIGSVEVGFAIGDLLQSSIDPTTCYLARHISGSTDNAFFLADGSTGWYRLNPNQVGASVSGEQTPVWSPKATMAAGIKAIASIETSPGVHQLLVGQTSTGAVLVRDLATFSDNGAAYTWSATIGSITLAMPGKLAEVESVSTQMNNISSAATQCSLSVLLDEISGSFESLSASVGEPPQITPGNTSLLGARFYLSQGTVPPVCLNMQIKLDGGSQTTKDELLGLTIRGAIVPEQS